MHQRTRPRRRDRRGRCRQDRCGPRRAGRAGPQPNDQHLPGQPSCRVRGLYAGIISALGAIPRFHKAALIPQTTELLAAETAERGRAVVLVLDEAHLLSVDVLEELRLLTNADMDSRSPFACLLVGQPTLRRRIKFGTFAALDQRIALRYAMTGMTAAETKTLPQPPPATRRPQRHAVQRRRDRARAPGQPRPAPRGQQLSVTRRPLRDLDRSSPADLADPRTGKGGVEPTVVQSDDVDGCLARRVGNVAIDVAT